MVRVLIFMFICLGFSSIAAAQTNAPLVHLRWDISPEPDTWEYRLYSCVDSTFALCKDDGPIAVISHPAEAYNVSDITTRTWFRLTAVDTSDNESDFSRIVDNRTPSAPLGVRIHSEVTVEVSVEVIVK